MNQLKREHRPEIMLEEVDFTKKEIFSEEIVKPGINKKNIFFKDLKRDISFISVVSIALFAVLGNISVYMWNKNIPSITYIPNQINLSETQVITGTAQKAATTLLNFDYTNINSPALSSYFYKNNLDSWQTTLKHIGIYDKVINNKGSVSTEILNVNLMSKSIVHGMVRNIIMVPFVQTYSDKNEKTVSKGNMILTMIENPDQDNQFVISNTAIYSEQTVSTTIVK